MNDAALLSSRVAEANARSPSREGATQEAEQHVVQSRMSPEAREDAIVRAHALVEYFQAEIDLYEALYKQSSCFSHRGDADRAKLNWRKAVDLLAALLAGRTNQGAKE